MFAGDAQPNTLSRPIAEAACAVGYFEKSRLHRSQAEIRLGAALLQQGIGPQFEAVGVSTTVRNYTLANATFVANWGLLLQDQSLIPETVYFAPEGWKLTASVSPTSLGGAEDIIIGFNNAHAGYQHWLTQCVPAIDWSLRQKRTKPARLLLTALATWQEDIWPFWDTARFPASRSSRTWSAAWRGLSIPSS